MNTNAIIMEYVQINKAPGVRGNIELKKENFFSLEPGTKVLQIGDGRENGVNRTDRFTSPLEYAGCFNSFKGNIKRTFYAFRLPEQINPEPETPLYLLYESTGLEIYQQRADTYNRFYKPEFITEEGNLLKTAV